MQLKLLAALCCTTLAAHAELLPQQAGDLTPAALRAAPATAALAAKMPAVAREPVSFSWASRAAVATPQPFVAQSREAYFTVTGAELEQGVALPTTAPRAIVRLQPVGEASIRENEAIHPSALILIDAAGRERKAGDGMETLVSADRLAKADLPFASGTSAFRLSADAGSGPLRMRAQGLSPGQHYLVNVVEPDSPLALTMQTTSAAYLQGQQLTVLAQLQHQAGEKVAPGSIDAKLVSPAGRSYPLAFKRGADGRMAAVVTPAAIDAAEPGLWEVQANVEATVKGQRALRSTRFAVPVALPTARLTRSADLAGENGALTVKLGIEAASAARYEVRGVLYGTVQGTLQPLAVGNAAQWVEPGQATIGLPFDATLLAGSTGPYELRDLQLIDQGRLAVLQRQQLALTMAESDVAKLVPQRSAVALPSSARMKKDVDAGAAAGDNQ
ncbi:DUF4785 domain-containing protein [Pseudoduganella chitinolytica]|uniref:DUF4785 family protein n=1 Tax=Pseudoduganella chitinolytica TaxID=34070 RepID=A0ABY8BA60_9BURK|nr:DUF4785 domain-containing protein [Pseudoduganella chitinolytica]WEF32695.1 DUF4785 family protein [Pseudoduganella chitinolytica]